MRLALNRGMEEVVHDLEHFDPAGQLPCAMYGPDAPTKLVRELDRDVTFNEVATAIARGYSNLLGGGERRDLRRWKTRRPNVAAHRWSSADG